MVATSVYSTPQSVWEYIIGFLNLLGLGWERSRGHLGLSDWYKDKGLTIRFVDFLSVKYPAHNLHLPFYSLNIHKQKSCFVLSTNTFIPKV